MSDPCECETVKLYDGKWQCMLCRKKFMPVDMIAELKLWDIITKLKPWDIITDRR